MPLMQRYIGDPRSRILAERLRQAAEAVDEPRRSTIMERLPQTVFVSHTSTDDRFLRARVLPVIQERFSDPFFHSRKTGGADAYEKIVGLALMSSHRVLSIWSENAAVSDYFLAEQHLAISESKSTIAFCIGMGVSLHDQMIGASVRRQICKIDASADVNFGLEQLGRVLATWDP
jgi:hypothetical protein